MGSGRRRGLGRLGAAIAVLAVALGIGVASAAARDFDNPASSDTSQQFGPASVQRDDTPDDPDYDYAEIDDPDATLNGGSVVPSTNLFDERFDLFGFPSLRTTLSARYTEGPHGVGGLEALNPVTGDPMVSGFNAAGAWKLTRGLPSVAVAVLDTGIKWDRDGLRTKVRLNRGELPVPAHDRATPSSDAGSVPACAAFTGTGIGGYDVNADDAFDVLDYACDSRVSPTAGPHGSPSLDPEDLIATFSNGDDAESNGFVDDIAGWDFFDNDNDPYDASSYFAASGHGSGRQSEVAERGNDGQSAIGVCPKCQLIPVRTWDTFVSDGNTFGMGILYATDNGASVVEGANGSIYHSAFAEAASNYAYQQGVVQTFSGDDLNTGNHNYPANYGHAMLIQGTVPDTVGLGTDAGADFAAGLAGLCTTFLPPALPVGCPGTNTPLKTYFRGANTTQYGGKSSIAMEGPTGSENTGKAAGAAALVISAAKQSPSNTTLSPDETREILEQTAERVTGGATGVDGNVAGVGLPDIAADPTADPIDQWSPHFGWGRVNLGEAVRVAATQAEIPPEAAINSPDWYAPTTGSTVHIAGAAGRTSNPGPLSWKLEWGVGEAPDGWTQFASGNGTTVAGDLSLTAVRSAIAAFTPPTDPGSPTFSPTGMNPFKNEFTVRLVVTAGGVTLPGVDRRVLSSAEDPDLRSGFPKRMGTGGEAPPRYADINGDNVQELMVPTEDGTIHAYEPDGSELQGWPVHTMQLRNANGHASAPGFAAVSSTPPLEPPRAPTIADLDDDGQPEVITTAGTHVYAWEPDGSLRPGFPVSSNLSFCGAALESQPLVHPKCGFLASPAVAQLAGAEGPADIVAPSLDGHLYAFDGHGAPVAGFPVALVDPDEAPADQMIAESINEPAVADLNDDGRDDVVVATNETYSAQPPGPDDLPGLFGQGLSDILGNAAGGSSRVYAVDSRGDGDPGGPFLPGWPIKLNGAIQSTLPLIGPGQNPAIAKINGSTRVIASATGSASIGVYTPAGTLDHAIQQGVYGPGSDATDRTGTINLFESASIGKLVPQGSLDIVKYGLSVSDVANLVLSGQNVPYNHLIGAYNAQSGTAEPAFPRITDDFQFLSSSDIANVNGSSLANQVVAGTGLGLLHAYDGVTGLDVAGFPKVTGGWLFAPATFSDDGRMADITREGYLFQWDLDNLPQCQSEWAGFRHDQQGSGNYDRDGTQPYAPGNPSIAGTTLSFDAPGDDYGCGAADHYEVATSDQPIGPTSFAAADRISGAPSPAAAGMRQQMEVPTHRRYVAIRAVDEAGNVGWTATVESGPPPPAKGACANLQEGTSGPDQLRGTSAGDRLVGLAGDDRLVGFDGKDCLSGGPDKDLLSGGDADDRLAGGRRTDVINGGAGDDLLKGNGGHDRLAGGPGKDKILGGPNRDIINAKGGGRDLVDCGPGQHDRAKVDGKDKVRNCEELRGR